MKSNFSRLKARPLEDGMVKSPEDVPKIFEGIECMIRPNENSKLESSK